MNCSPPGSSVHGISRARLLEWVVISFSRGSSWPRDWTQVSYIASRYFAIRATREVLRRIRDDAKVGGWRPRMMEFIFSEMGSSWDGNKDNDGTYFTGLFWGWKVKVLVAQSCLTLCNAMDCSPLVSSVHGILQTRILAWVVISFSNVLGSYYQCQLALQCIRIGFPVYLKLHKL